ncbi:hypothetical protein [Ascidiimonas sp. W6]|uniref:hypothetical protein n=1 Tax=Ascidiimonas meishanensis TaxID=3128903 RepID=UPI0030EC68CC
MRHIKIILLLLCLAPGISWSQAEVRDEVLAGEKAIVAGLLAALAVEKALIENSYKALGAEEQKYRDFLTTTPEAGTVFVYGITQVSLTNLETRIDDLLFAFEIARILSARVFRRYKQLKGELEREKVYLQRIRDDLSYIDVAALSPRITGGAGYSYTYCLKLFLRVKRIKSNVQKIDYEYGNSLTFMTVFR